MSNYVSNYGMEALGAVDWHVYDTAQVILNKRREGWSDAKITSWLLSDAEGRQKCPWNCDNEKVAAAFAYLATGKFPSGTTSSDFGKNQGWWPAATPVTAPSPPKKFPIGPVAIGVGVLAVVMLWRKR